MKFNQMLFNEIVNKFNDMFNDSKNSSSLIRYTNKEETYRSIRFTDANGFDISISYNSRFGIIDYYIFKDSINYKSHFQCYMENGELITKNGYTSGLFEVIQTYFCSCIEEYNNKAMALI